MRRRCRFSIRGAGEPRRASSDPTPATVAGYAGYRVLAEKNGVTLSFCWAHVRRKFYDLAAAGPAPIASEALERIAGLYRIETAIRSLSADRHRSARQDQSRPIVGALRSWLQDKLLFLSQKTRLADPTRYALSRWEGRCRFIENGSIDIDSNTSSSDRCGRSP